MTSAQLRGAAVRRVLLVTLGLNALVAVLKLVHGIETSTLSVKADGFHSAVDGINNLVGLLGVWWSLRPPDQEHPYGHQKVELLAASAVGTSLVLMAYNLVTDAVMRLGGGGKIPEPTQATVLLLVATLAINTFVTVYEARAAKRLHSTFLESDASHTRSDLLVTVGVLVTVLAVRSGYRWLDAGFAFVIAAFILLTGVQILSKNFNYLIDTAQVDVSDVAAVACRVPGVASVHKVRTRGTPASIVMDLHIQIARHLNVFQAHTVTHWVIEALKAELDGVHDVVVHTEPAPVDATYPPLPESLLAEK